MLKKVLKLLVLVNLPLIIIFINYDLSNDIYLFGLIGLSIVFSASIIILAVKDYLLQKRGKSVEEITRLGTIWFISPFMILISLIVLYTTWNTSRESGQITAYIVGGILGLVLGSLLMYRYLHGMKSQDFKTAQSQWDKVYIFFIVGLLLSEYLENMFNSFFQQYPSILPLLSGIVAILILFVGGIQILLGIIRKKLMPQTYM